MWTGVERLYQKDCRFPRWLEQSGADEMDQGSNRLSELQLGQKATEQKTTPSGSTAGQCVEDPGESVDWIAAEPPDEIERFRLLSGYRGGDRRIAAGRDIICIGSTSGTIFNILDGWVALYTLLPDGRRQIVQFALPGAVLGLFPSGGQATFGAQALTETVLSVIPYPQFCLLTRDDPAIALRMAISLARDCDLAFERITSIGRRTARERVAHLLLELFIRYRAKMPEDPIEEMHLPMTQEQLGDAIGLTFVHVNRVLRRLRRDGVVEFHYRRLRILNSDKLIKIAGMDRQIALAWIKQPL